MPYNQKVPLQKSEKGFYFQGTHNIRDAVIEQLRMLMMTQKGEYLMDYEYGVGINALLFENIDDEKKALVATEVEKQIKKYISRISVRKIVVFDRVDMLAGRIASDLGSTYAQYFNVTNLGEYQLLVGIFYSVEGSDTSQRLYVSVLEP